MDQLIIPKLIFFFVFITYLIDIVLILKREILSWSLMGVQGLLNNYFKLVNIVIIVKPTFLCYLIFDVTFQMPKEEFYAFGMCPKALL